MIGRKISHYTITAKIGEGGMGEVYRARDSRLGREVAIKILLTSRPLSPNALQRFRREAMAASALNHPNIVTIYEINTDGDTEFIAMEFVRGKALSRHLLERRLSTEEAVRYAIQISDALAKAHAAGIVHRDLKPGNIMLTEDGLIKVLDFGLAKFDANALTGGGSEQEQATLAQSFLTNEGVVTGTMAYMSPEQARGEVVDTRSDIFSLGIVLFQFLSGKTPFEGPNVISMLHRLHFVPAPDLGELREGLPKPLVSLVAKMLEKEPGGRIQTAAEVARALRGLGFGSESGPMGWALESPTLEMAGPGKITAKKRHDRRTTWLAAGVLIVLVSAAAVGWKYWKHPAPNSAGGNSSVSEGAGSNDNAFALYKQAREDLYHYDRTGNVERAIQRLERAVQLDPNSAASYAALGHAYYVRNRTTPDSQWLKLASEYAHKALELEPNLAAAHLAVGEVEMQEGRLPSAEQGFRRAVELDPKSAEGHIALAALLDKASKGEAARAELAKAIQIAPNDWRPQMEAGLNAFQAAKYAEAVAHWQQALKLEPDNVFALQSIGGAYHLLERDDDAAAALQKALEIRPDADTYNNLGTVRFYQGRYQDAVPAFEKTVQLGANDYQNWGNLGDAYRWTPGNAAKAKKAYVNAIRLGKDEIVKYPQQMDLRANVAMYVAKSGDKTAALETLKPVEQAPEKEAAVWFTMGIVYEICGDRKRALEALATAVKAGQSVADLKNEPELVGLRADPRYHLEVLDAVPKSDKGTAR